MNMRCRSVEPLVRGLLSALLFGGTVYAQVEIWVSRYDPGLGDWDNATAMALTPAGNPVVTGFSVGSDFSRDIATTELDAGNGDTVWVRRWSGGTSTRDEGRDLAIDDSGFVYVAGITRSATTDSDFVAIKYAPGGSPVWIYQSGAPGIDVPCCIAPSPSGGAVVAGYAVTANGRDWRVVSLAVDGSEVWVRTLDGPGHGADQATSLILNQAGDIYVAGWQFVDSSSVYPDYDYLTARYTASGDTVWTRRYDGTATVVPKTDRAYAITLDSTGSVYVTGRAGESGTWYDATTIKYDPTGSEVWVNRFDHGENGTDGASAIAVDRQGNVICGGITETAIGLYDMLVYKLRPNGQYVWQQTYDFVADDDSVTALTLDAGGNIYATGYSYSIEGDWDWVTFKYNTNGSLIWNVRHSIFDEDDFPYDIAVDQLGNVYVTGFDFGAGSEDYATVKYSEFDVGAGKVVAPTDTFRLGATVQPRVWVRNYSALELTFPVRLEIGNFYFDAQNVAGLAPFDSVVVEFTPWEVRDTGSYQVRCYTMLAGDKEPGNDTSWAAAAGVPVWQILPSLPGGPRDREIKDGGALGFVPDTLVFAFKGNNTTEFYAYSLAQDSWMVKETIPAYGSTGRKKRVKRGARLAPDTSGRVYAIKGNRTLEFWRYGIEGDSAGWVELAQYPIGGGRELKGGTGLNYVPHVNQIFSCKGSNTDEFYTYFVDGDSWVRLASVPLGPRGKRCKYGTCMEYDGDNTIFLLKGYTYEFYAYNIAADEWIALKELRNSETSSRRRKVKKGAGLAYDPAEERLYATKGGKTTEFWYYDVARDTWVETGDSVPTPEGTRRRPDKGACMEFADGKIYAFTGNKTLTFLKYHADLPLWPTDGIDGGVQLRSSFPPPGLQLQVVPSLVIRGASIQYVLPSSGPMSLGLYDASGRLCRLLQRGVARAGSHVLELRRGELAAGVYFLRLEALTNAGGAEEARKLLIGR